MARARWSEWKEEWRAFAFPSWGRQKEKEGRIAGYGPAFPTFGTGFQSQR